MLLLALYVTFVAANCSNGFDEPSCNSWSTACTTCQWFGSWCGIGDNTDCNDLDACTMDGCDDVTGCTYTPVTCDDGKECTTDSCSTASGCQYVNRGGSCTDDGNMCTDDVCSGGTCTHPFNTAPCDDGDACTDNDECSNGACAGSTITCDDGNVCTNDVCNGGTCSHTFNTLPCSDGDPCTLADTCTGGMCDGIPRLCDDNNICTDDSCVEGSCWFVPTTSSIACDDLNSCTTDDVCSAGVCNGTQINCDDGSQCTEEECVDGECVVTKHACSGGCSCPAPATCVSGYCECNLKPDQIPCALVCGASLANCTSEQPSCNPTTGFCTPKLGGETSIPPTENTSLPVLLLAAVGVSGLAGVTIMALVLRARSTARQLKELQADVAGANLTDGSGSSGSGRATSIATGTSAASQYSSARRSVSVTGTSMLTRNPSPPKYTSAPVSAFGTASTMDGTSIVPSLRSEHAPDV